MTKSLRGVTYDTEHDEEIVNPLDDGDNGPTYGLSRTGSGQFYLLGVIGQMYANGIWQKYDSNEELVAVGITYRPSPRLRVLKTISPVTEREAYSWAVKNVMPECFQARALKAA